MLSSSSTIWVLVSAALVFFMQAGFAMVETGFTRAKNAGNIIMKNLMDFAIGTIVFWVVGFGLMFIQNNGFVGGIALFLNGDFSSITPAGISTEAFVIFQTVFCATAATIVSGAMAERTKFSAYIAYSAVISALIYPISGHWIWGGGWLAGLGFHDFAGSTAVHMVGGIAALVGAKMLGARIGKYSKDGKARAIPGHSLTLGALGVFILWFAWFGFNGGSTVSAEGDSVLASMGHIFVTTNISAAVSTTTVMIITWIKYKKPDVSMTLNGALAGLVAITAGCDAVTPLGAAAIGLIAGFAVVFGIIFIDQKLKIDDPVGAIGVHGICGALGTMLVGIFAVENVAAPGGGGLIATGNFDYLGVEALGVVSVAAWVAVTISIVFFLIKKTIGLRVSKEEEIEGLDIHEHNLPNSYADFMPAVSNLTLSTGEEVVAPMESAIPITVINTPAAYGTATTVDGTKITKLVIITNQNKFENLKAAMERIGVTGMTVTQVLGCGMQNGMSEYYRGAKLEMRLLPKVKIEIVVCKVPVQTVVNAAKEALYTGNIGDGKIFIYNVEDVIKIRTGESGYDALQDEE